MKTCESREVRCRHCPAVLTFRAGYWQDPDGITVCAKAGADEVAQGITPQYLMHEPMPAPLDGAS
jgi:hypothetical protein